MRVVVLIIACAFAGAIDLPGSVAVPFTAAGLLMISAPRIIEKIQRARMLQQARVANVAIALFGMNAVAAASASYLIGQVLGLDWI